MLQKTVFNWIMKYKAILVALLLLVLCRGLVETVVFVINNTLVYITNFKGNAWLDGLFVFLTLAYGLWLWLFWIKRKRIVSVKLAALSLFFVCVYCFFRFVDRSYFDFTRYWNGPVAYLDGFALLTAFFFLCFLYQQTPCYKKSKKREASGLYTFDLDEPINKADDDLFNMGGLVTRIVSYVLSTDVKDSAFSIGVIGDWGDGKTSLMNLVEEKIYQEHKDVVIVHFNPRASKKSDNIQEDFLNGLKQSLKPFHSGVDKTIDEYAVAINAMPGLPVFVSKLLELFQVHLDKNRISKQQLLKQVIGDIGRRIVVFIDDLDRLTGEELIEVLKVLDTNGAFPNMVFLTSCDKAYVNKVLNNYLQLGNPSRPYTDKYFNVEIHVPLHPAFRLLDYLVKLLKNASDNGFVELDATTVEEQTQKVSAMIVKRLHSIRDVKRFANQFLYDYAEIQKDVVFRDFLLLELIKYTHPIEYEHLYKLEYVHQGAGLFSSSSSNDLFFLNSEIINQEEGTNTPASIDILKQLFPEENGYLYWLQSRYKRIYSISSFDHYFYNYELSHLTTEDIGKLYSADNLNEVCTMIDGYALFSKDLETYLLTRTPEAVTNKNSLKRFLHVLLYTGFKFPSYNYLSQYYTFLRKEDVSKIKTNCGFVDDTSYIDWFKESLEELFVINPLIPSYFVRMPLSGLLSSDSDQAPFVLSIPELQEYALALLKKYLQQIDQEVWSASMAFEMSSIHYDESGATLPAAFEVLHDAMINRFEKFSSELPLVNEHKGHCQVGFILSFAFKGIFKDYDEFEQLIWQKRYDQAPQIDKVRSLWQLFKANGCHNVQFDIEKELDEDGILEYALSCLTHIEDVSHKMDAIKSDLNQNKRLASDVISHINELQAQLANNPLKIELSINYQTELKELLNQIQTK